MSKIKVISVAITATMLFSMFTVFSGLQANAKSGSGYLKVKAVSKRSSRF